MEKVTELLRKRGIQIAIGAVAVFGMFVVLTYSKMNGIRATGVDKETALSAQYLDNQNELSAFISKFYEQLGIADHKSEQLDKILEDAVKGRYDNTGLQAVTPGESNQLISAIVEAYPDLSGLSVYDTVLNTISAGRDAYKNKQSKLLDMLRSYDKWRNEHIIGSVLIKISGFPSSTLKAQVGELVLTGDQAEAKMYQIVLTGAAVKAYEDNQLEPLTIPEDK